MGVRRRGGRLYPPSPEGVGLVVVGPLVYIWDRIVLPGRSKQRLLDRVAVVTNPLTQYHLSQCGFSFFKVILLHDLIRQSSYLQHLLV